GASQGEGLGNQFLAHIRETDAIAQVVRCFEDPDIAHVSGRVDPVADVETINTELALADLETTERALERAMRLAKAGAKEARSRVQALERIRDHLGEGRLVRTLDLDEADQALVRELHLLTAKPMLYVANVSEEGFDDNPHLDALRAYAAAQGTEVIPVSAAMEAEIAQLEEADRQEFLEAIGLQEPGLDRLIRAGYRLLGLLTFFTAGPKEVRAWTVRRGATAPEAAGRIHTDFEKGFIRAEVVAYEDFVRYGGEHGAKEAGKWRLEGRDYVIQEGDVVHFRFNV
ncbi:MAG TPA: redox-regulated ATPase YchF, partial [Chromatiales bacterium]|nr:redox-regulated ATPase YchF [Chromatiales bacterium]